LRNDAADTNADAPVSEETRRELEAKLAVGNMMLGAEDHGLTRTASEQARDGGSKLRWKLSEHDMNAAGWAYKCNSPS